MAQRQQKSDSNIAKRINIMTHCYGVVVIGEISVRTKINNTWHQKMILGKMFQPFALILYFQKYKLRTPSVQIVKLLQSATWLTLYPTINLRYRNLSIKNSATKTPIYSVSAHRSNIHIFIIEKFRTTKCFFNFLYQLNFGIKK